MQWKSSGLRWIQIDSLSNEDEGELVKVKSSKYSQVNVQQGISKSPIFTGQRIARYIRVIAQAMP